MKTTFDLPEEIVREVKRRAVLERRTVKELVTDALRKGLGMETSERHSKSNPIEIGDDSLPRFRCAPGAPASRMTQEELLGLEQAALAEEDRARAGLSL